MLENTEHRSNQIVTFLFNDVWVWFFGFCLGLVGLFFLWGRGRVAGRSHFNIHGDIKYCFDTFFRVVLFYNVIIQGVMYRNQ